MAGLEEHLLYRVPNEDDKDLQDKLDKLNQFTEKANFVRDSKSGIEQCDADPDRLRDRARALLKALGFEKKVTLLYKKYITKANLNNRNLNKCNAT